MVNKDELPKNLNFIPTVVTDEGSDVVVFDEIIVEKGCSKWILTVCGYFVGYKIAQNELKYHIGECGTRTLDGQ